MWKYPVEKDLMLNKTIVNEVNPCNKESREGAY